MSAKSSVLIKEYVTRKKEYGREMVSIFYSVANTVET